MVQLQIGIADREEIAGLRLFVHEHALAISRELLFHLEQPFALQHDRQNIGRRNKFRIIDLDQLAQKRFGIFLLDCVWRGGGRHFIDALPMRDESLPIARALAVLLLPARRADIQPHEIALLVKEQRVIALLMIKSLAAALASMRARLDIPLWVYERGLLDEVINLVRAEVIVGNGYPYVIETADAAAVINTRDREAFYAIFQRFAADVGVDLRVSQKAASKARRR